MYYDFIIIIIILKPNACVEHYGSSAPLRTMSNDTWGSHYLPSRWR